MLANKKARCQGRVSPARRILEQFGNQRGSRGGSKLKGGGRSKGIDKIVEEIGGGGKIGAVFLKQSSIR